MLLFLLRRIVSGIVLIFVIATATFFLMSLTGSDPARTIAGATAGQAQVQAEQKALGLNQPVVTRYLKWLGHAVRGDLGTSWFSNQPVSKLLSNSLPVSLSIVGAATILTAIISIALGVLAAVRGGWLDRVVQAGAVLGFAVPNFLVGLVVALIFAVKLGWLPAVGYVHIGNSAGGWLKSITLPAIALAIGAIASVAQQARGSMIDVLQLDYIRTLRARGLPTRSVLFRHALRNAAPPALTVLSLQFIGLISGAVVVEKVFGLSGIGSLANSSASQGDVPLVLGVVVATVVIVVVVNLIIDLAYGALNPKVRAR